MTRSLQDYITEAEAYVSGPVAGDEFDIEIAPGDIVSTYVLESTEDSVTVYGDETMMSLLETIRRYGAVGSNNAMGYSLEEASLSDLDVERQDYERMTPGEFQRAYGKTKQEWQREYDQMFNRLQGQTLKAMQRTQKKDPDYCDACDRPNNRCVCESLVQEAQAVSATTVADAIFRAIKRDYADQGFTWSGDIYDFWEFLDEYEGSRFVDQYWALSQRDQRAVFAAVKQAIKQHFSSGDDVADARGRGLMTRMREQDLSEDQFFQRVLELAGCKSKMEEEEANTTDPLADKAAALAPVGAIGDEQSATTIDEGQMKSIAAELGEIADTEDFDRLYDLMTSTSPAGAVVQRIADDVAIDNRLGDDDHEEILELVMDRLIDEFGGYDLDEAEYQGREVELNKPKRGGSKKFYVYVKDPKSGNVRKISFGDPNMKIKKSNPARRKSFRARHRCDNPGPKTKARYWACRSW